MESEKKTGDIKKFDDPDLVPCKHMFSNGTEYMIFIETQCDNCTRFRKGYCRTFRRTELARWDEKYFPYDDLLEYKRYAGKVCKRFTTEKLIRKKPVRKQVKGQVEMILSEV